MKNLNWYEGAKQLTPSTNNSLEATNRVIKDQFTLRERLSIREFGADDRTILKKKYNRPQIFIWTNHFDGNLGSYLQLAESETGIAEET